MYSNGDYYVGGFGGSQCGVRDGWGLLCGTQPGSSALAPSKSIDDLKVSCMKEVLAFHSDRPHMMPPTVDGKFHLSSLWVNDLPTTDGTIDYWEFTHESNTFMIYQGQIISAPREENVKQSIRNELRNGKLYLLLTLLHRHGTGQCHYYSDSSKVTSLGWYEGEWKHHQRCGKGSMYYESDEKTFETCWINGQWIDNHPESDYNAVGTGHFVTSDGSDMRLLGIAYGHLSFTEANMLLPTPMPCRESEQRTINDNLQSKGDKPLTSVSVLECTPKSLLIVNCCYSTPYHLIMNGFCRFETYFEDHMIDPNVCVMPIIYSYQGEWKYNQRHGCGKHRSGGDTSDPKRHKHSFSSLVNKLQQLSLYNAFRINSSSFIALNVILYEEGIFHNNCYKEGYFLHKRRSEYQGPKGYLDTHPPTHYTAKVILYRGMIDEECKFQGKGRLCIAFEDMGRSSWDNLFGLTDILNKGKNTVGIFENDLCIQDDDSNTMNIPDFDENVSIIPNEILTEWEHVIDSWKLLQSKQSECYLAKLSSLPDEFFLPSLKDEPLNKPLKKRTDKDGRSGRRCDICYALVSDVFYNSHIYDLDLPCALYHYLVQQRKPVVPKTPVSVSHNYYENNDNEEEDY